MNTTSTPRRHLAPLPNDELWIWAAERRRSSLGDDGRRRSPRSKVIASGILRRLMERIGGRRSR